MSDKWMSCSICRADLPFGGTYYSCSVSTCNRARTRLVFCSVACWDSHLAVLHHREAWAVEEQAPTREAWAAQEQAQEPHASADAPPAPPAARRVVAPSAAPAARPDDDEILIVVSKLKKYIRDRSGMNTSDGVAGPLSDHVRAICDEAIEAARAAGRKTVLDRDVPRRR